jgi:hypothetical protein
MAFDDPGKGVQYVEDGWVDLFRSRWYMLPCPEVIVFLLLPRVYGIIILLPGKGGREWLMETRRVDHWE